MKISLLIPCVNYHFKYLDKLMSSILSGTVIPDQILISLNGCKKLDKNIIKDFENKYKKNVTVIKSKNVLQRSDARNILIQNVTGDIITFCDSDDILHPQRIEIIKYFFENHDIRSFTS